MDKSWLRWLWKPIEKWFKPVQVAVQDRNIQKIILLKRSGADFSIKSKNGRNLLHLLAEKNCNADTRDEEIFDLLLSEHCFDVNATDEDGVSALHLAAKSCNRLIALKLIEHGAEVDCRDKNMATPLHYAVTVEQSEVVELLLSKGANVNAKGYKGARPIHLLKSYYDLGTLVRHGAHLDALDEAGQTALAQSISVGNSEFALRLCMFGADVANDSSAFDVMAKREYKGPLAPDVVLRFLIKLKVASLIQSSTFYNIVNQMDVNLMRLADHIHKSNCESVWLKRTHFDERTTIYDVLHMDPNERCRFICARLKQWQNFSRHSQFDEHLSYFSHVIKACGYQAQVRKRLLKLAKKAWSKLINISLPDLCIDRILSHLSNSELLRMVDGDES